MWLEFVRFCVDCKATAAVTFLRGKSSQEEVCTYVCNTCDFEAALKLVAFEIFQKAYGSLVAMFASNGYV